MTPADKPFSTACARNRKPILEVLQKHFADRETVLEIGSGTGQHAVFFAAALSHLQWQPSDRAENLPGINLWLEEAALPNLRPAIKLDVNGDWPKACFDAVFSANTLHIMSWEEVQRMFERLPDVLAAGAKVVIYGPFNYDDSYTSDSNAVFDNSLKAAAPHMGIRDFEAVDRLAQGIGLQLLQDHEMPANNRCLAWQRH